LPVTDCDNNVYIKLQNAAVQNSLEFEADRLYLVKYESLRERTVCKFNATSKNATVIVHNIREEFIVALWYE